MGGKLNLLGDCKKTPQGSGHFENKFTVLARWQINAKNIPIAGGLLKKSYGAGARMKNKKFNNNIAVFEI